MPAQSIEADAIVLLRQPPSDNFQTLSLFASEHGVITALQRVPKKSASAATLLDLFDEISVLLETSNQGRTYFVKEAQVKLHHAEIGRSYDALRLASALTTLVARNQVHEDSRTGVASLLRTALLAFGTSNRPDIVYFKSVYRFARDEGYPLKEEWFQTLAAADKAELATLINRPLSEQTAPLELVARLQRRLEEYLRANTEIFLSPA